MVFHGFWEHVRWCLIQPAPFWGDGKATYLIVVFRFFGGGLAICPANGTPLKCPRNGFLGAA